MNPNVPSTVLNWLKEIKQSKAHILGLHRKEIGSFVHPFKCSHFFLQKPFFLLIFFFFLLRLLSFFAFVLRQLVAETQGHAGFCIFNTATTSDANRKARDCLPRFFYYQLQSLSGMKGGEGVYLLIDFIDLRISTLVLKLVALKLVCKYRQIDKKGTHEHT